MKVLVIGATGGTGRHLVRRLLARGHDVRALARETSAVGTKHVHLEVVRGDARDAASIDDAVAGVDAVVCAFGPRSLKKGDIQEVLARNLLAAMHRHGVRRLVNLSAWGAGESAATAGLVFAIARRTILRYVYDDKELGEVLVLGSDLDFVNVRPGRLSDDPPRGGVKATSDGRGVGHVMARADLADFMVTQLESDEWVRRSPIIGYAS
jgi:uncharacterized protein YbjT (DUF2867 family)